MMLPLESVTAIGLAATELVTNSYRHAFPEHAGTITVRLARAAGDSGATVSIHDNGVGFVAAAMTARRGLGLVRRLVKQIDGTLDMQSDAGTLWTLGFPAQFPADGPGALNACA